jgi:CBS-domain-containing membrane protein
MQTEVISITPWTDLQAVAILLEAHDLLALPVVDEREQLLGCVTLEALLPHLVPAQRTRHRLIAEQRARTEAP